MVRIEVEVAAGLGEIAQAELLQQCIESHLITQRAAIQFDYSADINSLHRLRVPIAAYRVEYFDVPRPRALLGHEHFTRLLNAINDLDDFHHYQTLHVSAAGSESSVMIRFKQELADHTGLHIGKDAGDLMLRLRRNRPGWDVLIRLTPRPLVTRHWRVCDLQGALNAGAAYAMVLLTDPTPDDIYCNLATGSGTLLIERAAWGPSRSLVGVDHANHSCAQVNLAAAKCAATCISGDLRQVPLADSSVSVIAADLPFGQLTGSHDVNQALYPVALREAARIAMSNARAVIITHEIRLMEETLKTHRHLWKVNKTLKVDLRGINPRIYVLQRVPYAP
jgi:tRNA (guanine6-N2)-methyltransferase